MIFKGERVSHLYRNNVFYAHLSIYAFATRFCQGKNVLDAGSGAGYGAAYLAEHGAANVLGVDVSEDAVRFSRENFRLPNLEFRQLDLEELDRLQPRRFDLIYSSNVLEHVPNAAEAIAGAAGLLADDGWMVIAVPPIVHQPEWEANVMNCFHLNLWTPRQWLMVLRKYFGSVQPYVHQFSDPGLEQEPFENSEEDTHITELDFEFAPCEIEEYYRRRSISALFVAGKPVWRAGSDPHSVTEFVEGSFTRPLRSPDAPIYQVSSVREARLRALAILHDQGFGALSRRALRYLFRSLIR